MKPSYSVLLTCLLALVTGCSTKIDTIAPYKDYTFVYGMLDAGDTAHYIRIQKAFLSSGLSVYDMTRVPDSSFYLNLDVRVKEIDPASGNVRNTFNLDKVNLTLEGYGKDTGVFFTEPSYAYKFKQKLSHQYRYRLVIYNPQTGETDSAETAILSEDSLSTGDFFVTQPQFNVNNSTIDFGTINLNFHEQYDPNQTYTIEGLAPDSTEILQIYLVFHWWDRDINSSLESAHYYNWNYATLIFPAPAGNKTSAFSVSNKRVDFLNTLKVAMGAAPPNIHRFLDSCDIYVYAGTSPLYNYQMATGQIGGNVTGNSAQPIFSNIQGQNVFGLFAARAKRFKLNIPFAEPALNFILNNAILDSTGLQKTISSH